MQRLTDGVLRAMLDDGSFRIIAARTTATVAGILAVQSAQGQTAEALGSLVTGAILFRETMAPGYRVQAILRGADEQSVLVADSNPTGAARALVQLARGATELEVAPGAQLQLMRSLANGSINQGVVAVPESGDLADAMMAYMESSEQVTTMVGIATKLTDGTVTAAGGYMVQLLPEARPEGIARMVERLEQLGALAPHLTPDFTPEQLVALLVGEQPTTRLGESPVEYACWCSEVRVMSALATLHRQDLEEMIAAGEPVELNCDYCRTTYRIPPSRLQGLLQDS